MAREPILPEVLRPRTERMMRSVVRAIAAAHPTLDRTIESRVMTAVSAMLGLREKTGAPTSYRDDLLELMAFKYSVETRWHNRTDVSLREIAKGLVDAHPEVVGNSERESVIRYLLRTFKANRERLLAEHSYDGSDNFDEFYRPIRTILLALQSAGVPVEWSVLPPGAKVNWADALSVE